jgi:hypothetical protein
MRTQLQIIILAESLALHAESKDDELSDETQEEYESLLASHLDRLSISGMLESDNDFSEQFMREILLPLYLPPNSASHVPLSDRGLVTAPDSRACSI